MEQLQRVFQNMQYNKGNQTILKEVELAERGTVDSSNNLVMADLFKVETPPFSLQMTSNILHNLKNKLMQTKSSTTITE